MIRVRIAPSPTGFLHIGNARTFLFNYLFAKKNKGALVLRIEDTDLERSNKKYEKDIIDGLGWLGIEADESPLIGGPYAPYRQSERLDRYKKYLGRLLEGGFAFYCFHTEEELERERRELLDAKQPQLHSCEFRTLSLRDAEALIEIKPQSIIRFKTPPAQLIKFNDLIRGHVEFDSGLLGDFSLAKDLDTPLYNFAVVVDDYEMEISHVIRGEDHIPNTPKQLLLIEALRFPRPHYAHLPLILGNDRSKFSKRHGAVSVTEYKEVGYLPEALFNFLALLGWNPGGDIEILTQDELIQKFSLEKVQKSGAIFDLNKLDWMNGEYIRRKTVKDLADLSKLYLKDFSLNKFSDEYLEKVIGLEQPRLRKLSEIGEGAGYFFRDPQYDKELLRWKNMSDEEIIFSLNKSIELLPESGVLKISEIEIKKLFLEEAEKIGDRGKLLWPLRVALSGKKASPGPFEIMDILGKEKTLRRLRLALKLF